MPKKALITGVSGQDGAYLSKLLLDTTDPTELQTAPSASLDSAIDFGSTTNDAVGQVKIVGGDIFIYTD